MLDLFENYDWKKTSVIFSPVQKLVGTVSYILNKKLQKKKGKCLPLLQAAFHRNMP